ncbi:MAG: hypothetical protein E6H01_12635 [Bacillati bacterium ANGP1]|uniref:Uncharacterized protein n=1 Tax=Candidatus Segetimicrobium genomatis TaxID=2569760 RepID=A0A537KR20_9BACT|nr:MAG: hypothetical protein E6H01_12635 [Terrabacteria group bacterium ANGP1]
MAMSPPVSSSLIRSSTSRCRHSSENRYASNQSPELSSRRSPGRSPRARCRTRPREYGSSCRGCRCCAARSRRTPRPGSGR